MHEHKQVGKSEKKQLTKIIFVVYTFSEVHY